MYFPSIVNLLAAPVTTNSDSASFKAPVPSRLEARVTGTGALTATVAFFGKIHPDADWEAIGSGLALSGTAKASKTLTVEFPYYQYKVTVSSLTGTGAAVNISACA